MAVDKRGADPHRSPGTYTGEECPTCDRVRVEWCRVDLNQPCIDVDPCIRACEKCGKHWDDASWARVQRIAAWVANSKRIAERS